MKNNTEKKRTKIAAAAAVLSAAAIIIILLCVWNVSSKKRTVDALNENASKAEATSGIKAACDAIASGKSVSEILTDSDCI